MVKRVSRGALLSTAGTRGQAWPALRSSKGRPSLREAPQPNDSVHALVLAQTAQCGADSSIALASAKAAVGGLAFAGATAEASRKRAVVDLLQGDQPCNSAITAFNSKIFKVFFCIWIFNDLRLKFLFTLLNFHFYQKSKNSSFSELFHGILRILINTDNSNNFRFLKSDKILDLSYKRSTLA